VVSVLNSRPSSVLPVTTPNISSCSPVLVKLWPKNFANAILSILLQVVFYPPVTLISLCEDGDMSKRGLDQVTGDETNQPRVRESIAVQVGQNIAPGKRHLNE
jgi:hypothetical protein